MRLSALKPRSSRSSLASGSRPSTFVTALKLRPRNTRLGHASRPEIFAIPEACRFSRVSDARSTPVATRANASETLATKVAGGGG